MDGDELFKLPQITTRSRSFTYMTRSKMQNATKNARAGIVSKRSPCKKKVGKEAVVSNREKAPKSTETKDVQSQDAMSVCSDSGYNTNESVASRDCGSVHSRESGFSETYRSNEEIYLDNLSDLSRLSMSPTDMNPYTRSRRSASVRGVKIVALQSGNVKALLPMDNASNYKGNFTLRRESNGLLRDKMEFELQNDHISPIVSLSPHGIEFHEHEPAILIMPLRIEPENESRISVICSNTESTSAPRWQRMCRQDFYIKDGFIVITLRHLSLFTAILEEPFPEIMKKIRCRTGGRLRIPEVPGIEVNFSRGCLDHDIDAYLRVLFDKDPLERSEERPRLPLASPIISLGPHGLKFSESRQPVFITLPIPEYAETIRRCPTARLAAFQSSMSDSGDPMTWERVDVTLTEPKVIAYRHGISGIPIPSVTFPVYHFSFFKVVWEMLSSTLYEAKMGMSYFYPYISFSMMCQAFMEESHENNRFGLEVICYRSDRKLPETTNYRHRVGASLKPKLVRPGRIIVRLRSQMFEADVDAGEEVDMAKEESDFRGRDFEKQYACRFKPDSTVERGPFGKVIVERLTTRNDPLFEFNLHKTGVEATENSPAAGCERWTVFAMKELASSLLITEGNNWRLFAKHIGFTKSEIKNKLNYSPDPFLALMNMYNSRGGTPEEFIQALYVVSREIRVGANTGNISPGSRSSKSSRSNESGSLGSGSQESSSPIKRLFNLWPRNRDSDSTGQGSSSSARKRRMEAKPSPPAAAPPKRRRLSDNSDEPKSSSSDEPEEKRSESTGKHRNCSRKLNDKDMWRISQGIARKDWRNLGRTLGIEENVLGNLEHSHHSVGLRECAYQMLLEWKGRKPKKCTFGELYSALLREKMNSVAKYMVRKVPTSSDGKEDSDSD